MLQKVSSGIAGLDEVTGGGFPEGRVVLVEGGAGSGKTVLAAQSLSHAAAALDEPGIFVAFEEHADRIRINLSGFQWFTPGPENLHFLDAQPSVDSVRSGDFDLQGLLSGLDALVERTGARRIVFDALDVLLGLLPDARDVRREVYRLHEWLLERELSAVITAKSDAHGHSGSGSSREFLLFMVDAVLVLQHEVVNGISQRSLRVLKYRGTSFDGNLIPAVISDRGLELAALAPIDQPLLNVSDERISTGVDRLDTMLSGGYHRAASVLITGAPGTAKTTLAGAFLEAACQRNERALLVSYDSRGEEIVRNLASVGIDLGTHVEKGLLMMQSAAGLGGSSEIQLMRIRRWAEQHQARCIAIDPASALASTGSAQLAQSVMQRLVDWCKQQGITLLTTSLLDRATQDPTHTPLHISTIADTWIHLEYRAEGGERNRALSVIKSRGTAHSNQVRELVLGTDGISLTDVYAAGGEVLMGTLRMERERAEERQRLHEEQQYRELVAGLDAEAGELEQQLLRMKRQLQEKREEIETVRASHQQTRERDSETGERILDHRRADRDHGNG